MQVVVGRKTVVPAGETRVGMSIDMNGANAVQVALDVVSLVGGNELTVTVNQGNDLSNWSFLSSSSVVAVGFSTFRVTGIAAHFIQLVFVLDGVLGDRAIFETEVNTERL